MTSLKDEPGPLTIRMPGPLRRVPSHIPGLPSGSVQAPSDLRRWPPPGLSPPSPAALPIPSR